MHPALFRLFAHAALLIGFTVSAASAGQAPAPTLAVADRNSTQSYPIAALLKHPAAREIDIADDSVYHRPMHYLAVPVAELLKGLALSADDYVEVKALDGFSVSIPGHLLTAPIGSATEAFLAIETPGRDWLALPDKKPAKTAGPFYVVWQVKAPATIGPEYWAYQVASLKVTDSPQRRWPALGISADAPAQSTLRHGLELFVSNCMACHRFNGAGEALLGPDLGSPMNPAHYFQRAALKTLIRKPSAVRTWPQAQMSGFDEATLGDADIDAVIDWLEYKARTSTP